MKRKLYRDQEMHHDICGIPMVAIARGWDIFGKAGVLRVNAMAGRQAHTHENSLRLCFTLFKGATSADIRVDTNWNVHFVEDVFAVPSRNMLLWCLVFIHAAKAEDQKSQRPPD
jgi:hypothetical protein